GLDAELDQDRPEELRSGHRRVQDEGGPALVAELGQNRPADGRLARADLTGQLDEALALADAEEDVVEGLAVLIREEQEPGVRGDVDGGPAEAVDALVPGLPSLRPAGPGCRLYSLSIRMPPPLVWIRSDAPPLFSVPWRRLLEISPRTVRGRSEETWLA